jgi:bacillopeptidase F
MTKRKPKSTKNANYEQQLKKQLFLIIAISVGSLIAVTKFGPKIGALFGFLSLNKNASENTISAALPPPVFDNPPEAVKEDKVTLEGTSEPNSTVNLFVNGPQKDSVVTDLEGKFTFTDIKLIKGRNTIFAKAEDGDRKSEKSETIKIEVDDDSPEITIEKPKDGDTIKNLNKTIQIQGKINEEAQITINDRVVVQKGDNSFDFLLGVDEGNIEIKVKAVDLAGNEKEKTLQVRYEKRAD